ncbi:MAG: addiction module toxin RelE [Gammaproteobacteria bacterium]|nr:addiction module toxin RelE [Gammaproteobacteria bacterium]
MTWKIEFDAGIEKQLRQLDKKILQRIFTYLKEKDFITDNPRQYGKALKGILTNLWRYRVSDYRIICQILDNEMIILVIRLGYRKDIYQ